jgi:hypothetical protein
MFSAGSVAGVIITAAVVVLLFLKIINLGARSPTLYPGCATGRCATGTMHLLADLPHSPRADVETDCAAP